MNKFLYVRFVVATCVFFNSIAFALSDIPYESNDNSYVYVQNMKLSEENEDITMKVFDKVDIRPFSFPQCNGLPVEFAGCKKSICISKSKFGNVYHRVNGYNADKFCTYEERTPGFGGIDCLIPSNSFQQMTLLLNKSLNSLEVQNQSLTQDENIEYSAMIKKFCHTVSDASLYSPITINSLLKGNYNYETTDNNIFDSPVINKSNAKPVLNSDTVNKNPKNFLLTKSIMLTKNELDYIAKYFQNDTNESGERLFQKSSNGKSFYYNSVIFLEKDKWIIWVNGQKIAKGERIPDFDVISITDSYALLKFTVKNVSKTMPLWARNFLYNNPKYYTNKSGSIELNVDDDDNATILAKLKPNQSIEINNLQIGEGN